MPLGKVPTSQRIQATRPQYMSRYVKLSWNFITVMVITFPTIPTDITTANTAILLGVNIWKTRWPPWSPIDWDISTSPLKPLNGIQRNLTGNKIWLFSTKFVFLKRSKNKMAALASDWLILFQLFPQKTPNGIQRNLTGSKVSMSSTKFVFFVLICKQN